MENNNLRGHSYDEQVQAATILVQKMQGRLERGQPSFFNDVVPPEVREITKALAASYGVVVEDLTNSGIRNGFNFHCEAGPNYRYQAKCKYSIDESKRRLEELSRLNEMSNNNMETHQGNVGRVKRGLFTRKNRLN